MSRFLTLLAVFCLSVVWVSAGDWPKFLGPKADGFATDKGINKDWGRKPPKLVWKAALNDKPAKFSGYAGPAAAAGKVYIVDAAGGNDLLKAFDLKTGEKLWEASFKAGADGANCTPLFDSGKLYIVSSLGVLNCVAADKGAPLWSVDLVKDYGSVPPNWKHAWSPMTDGDALLLTAGGPDATVVALDKATGKLLWKGGKTDGAGYAPVVTGMLGGKKCYIASAQTSVQALDANGAVLWSFPWENKWKVNAAAPIVADGKVFITSGYGRGCALLDGKTGKPDWENTSIMSHMSTPVLSGGCVYSTSDPGKLVCLELKSGKVRWEQAGFEKGGLCAVDGTLIVVDGAKGDVAQVAMDPTTYKELGRIPAPLGGQSWTAPIVADGCLILRNKKTLACLDLM